MPIYQVTIYQMNVKRVREIDNKLWNYEDLQEEW